MAATGVKAKQEVLLPTPQQGHQGTSPLGQLLGECGAQRPMGGGSVDDLVAVAVPFHTWESFKAGAESAGTQDLTE